MALTASYRVMLTVPSGPVNFRSYTCGIFIVRDRFKPVYKSMVKGLVREDGNVGKS